MDEAVTPLPLKLIRELGVGDQKWLSELEVIVETLDDFLVQKLGQEKGEKVAKLFFEWIKTHCGYVGQESTFAPSILPDLNRGDVVHVDFGFNVGCEFGGGHYAAVLKRSPSIVHSVLVVPLSSKKPKPLPIYVEVNRIIGLGGHQNLTNTNDPDIGKHWINILNIRSVSKIRVRCQNPKMKLDGQDLDKVSAAIAHQIALRQVSSKPQ